MLASILLLLSYLGLLFSMYFLIRNKRVHAFLEYVNNLVFINNILAIRRNGSARYTREQFPSYNKILYSFKPIKSYHKLLWCMKQGFTRLDLNLLNDSYHHPEIHPSVQDALVKIEMYQIKYICDKLKLAK
jgi:hypothetical protein